MSHQPAAVTHFGLPPQPHPHARPYRGRFAPSPTGALHAGSLVAALASWLDARAHGGVWLVRIEDVDIPRCIAGADQQILRQLADCGLISDEPVVYQSQRSALYQHALDHLIASQWAYPCACSRKDIEEALARAGLVRLRHRELIYPGTCRAGLQGKATRAWRFKTAFFEPNQPLAHVKSTKFAIESVANGTEAITWHDRYLGPQSQSVETDVGDFVLQRADGLWAYQLAVVVDDADQGVTDVVRGQDLADNTARQILLQRALGLSAPRYLHTPLVLAADGHKLSKQNGAAAIDTQTPEQALAALGAAAQVLGLGLNPSAQASTIPTLGLWLAEAVGAWKQRLAMTP